jgi:ubiquinone/menaquinone biosynthesis C-methylase UbiE
MKKITEIIAEHYSTSMFEYELERLTHHSPVEFAITARYLQQWIAPGSEVGDIGSGFGHYAELLARRECKVHLVDVTARLLDAATQRLEMASLGPRIASKTLASATDLSFIADASLDAVLVLGPLYNLPDLEDRQAVAREARRVLKPGGVVFAAGINRLAYLHDMFATQPTGEATRRALHARYLELGVLDPNLTPPLAWGHMTTTKELRCLFSADFEELVLAGVESFTGHHQQQFVHLSLADQQAWLDLVYQTGPTEEGRGASEHLLFIGRAV